MLRPRKTLRPMSMFDRPSRLSTDVVRKLWCYGRYVCRLFSSDVATKPEAFHLVDETAQVASGGAGGPPLGSAAACSIK